MPPLSFRHATLQDAAALAALASAAFTQTYRGLDDPQEIADYVAEHFNVDAVRKLLADPRSTTVLAESGHALAGYAVLAQSPCPPCVTGPAPIELARFYLAAPFIGGGRGAQLLWAVHREARRRGARTLWLGVYDRNVRAVRFYERSGLAKVGGKEFMFGGRAYIDPIYAGPVREDDVPGESAAARRPDPPGPSPVRDDDRAMPLTWSVHAEPDADDLAVLADGVMAHGRAAAFDGHARPIACLVRDDDGQLVAGGAGRTEYQRLFVSHLWVTEALRRRGIGSRILHTLETEAVRRGCRDAIIETLDASLADAYARRGYEVLARVNGYVGRFDRFILLKPSLAARGR